MPSIRGAICSALPKSLSEILELLAGFEFADRQAGNLDRFLQFGIAGSRASRSRPRTYHSQRRTAVGFSAVTTGKKIVKLTSANWHKNLPALPQLHQENTCSLHRRAIFLTKFIARNGVIRRFVIERISRPVG